MSAKKKENKIDIIPFKNTKTDFWVNKKHYSVVGGEIKLIAGGMLDDKEVEMLKSYLSVSSAKI